MLRMRRRSVVAGLAVGAVVGLRTTRARAQTSWPDHPVRVIVPYAPGAGTDFIVRAVAERLSRQNGLFAVERFENRVVLLSNVSFTVPVGPLRCFAMITSAMLSGWKSGSLIL